jgi:16S rRNA (uracil1498-N3)-methyltransferase
MSERFYINWPLSTGAVTLDGPEARHLATVCRFRPGDAVCLFNGDGHEYPARVVAADRKHVELEVI